jgi:hypothetical protein
VATSRGPDCQPTADDLVTICATSLVAGILANVSHEGLGHALLGLLTGARSGVVSTVAWSSAHGSRLVAAGGTLANLVVGSIFLWALSRAKNASPETRFFLFAAAAFNLLAGTGYFFFSGVSDFGDWAAVITDLAPHWLWRLLLTLVGLAAYLWTTRLLATSLVRYFGVPRQDKARLRKLCWIPYFSGLALSLAAGLLNPLGLKLVFESALPAAAGGNCGLLWMRHYAAKGASPVYGPEPIGRSYAWLAAATALCLAFIFILGPGIRLHS